MGQALVAPGVVGWTRVDWPIMIRREWVVGDRPNFRGGLAPSSRLAPGGIWDDDNKNKNVVGIDKKSVVVSCNVSDRGAVRGRGRGRRVVEDGFVSIVMLAAATTP